MTPGRAGREVTVSSQILCMVSFVAPIATWRDREPWLPFLRPTRRPRAGALKARLGFGVQSARRDENRETQSEAGKLEKQRQTLDRRPPACCVAASQKMRKCPADRVNQATTPIFRPFSSYSIFSSILIPDRLGRWVMGDE